MATYVPLGTRDVISVIGHEFHHVVQPPVTNILGMLFRLAVGIALGQLDVFVAHFAPLPSIIRIVIPTFFLVGNLKIWCVNTALRLLYISNQRSDSHRWCHAGAGLTEGSYAGAGVTVRSYRLMRVRILDHN